MREEAREDINGADILSDLDEEAKKEVTIALELEKN